MVNLMNGTTEIKDTRSRQEIENLIKFCSGIVIKNPNEAEQNESLESNARGYKLISVCLKSDTLDSYDREAVESHLGFIQEYLGKRYYRLSEVPSDKIEIVLDYERWLVYKDYMKTGDSNQYYQDIYNKYIKDDERIAKDFDEFRKSLVIPFFVTARLAKDFSLLYVPFGTNVDINKYKKCYGYVQNYFINALYNDAYAITNPKYDNLCQLIIIFMSIERYLNTRLENIDDIDFFDEYSIRNLFLSYGLDYFFDMPLQYQKRILKNINFLVKNKGTDKDLVNALSIFGFSNIKIMKYFLCKEYQKDENGNLDINDTKLLFYGIDIEKQDLEHALKDKFTTRTDYDIFVSSDKYWQLTEDEYQKVIAEPFNQIYSKYISLNVYNNIYKNGAKYSSLVNLIYYIQSKLEEYDDLDKNKLYFYDNKISDKKIYILDALIGMYILLHKKYGIEATISTPPDNITKVIGFNYDYLKENIINYTRKYIMEINSDISEEKKNQIKEDYNNFLKLHHLDSNYAITNTLLFGVLDNWMFKNEFLKVCNDENIDANALLGKILTLVSEKLPERVFEISALYNVPDGSEDPNSVMLSNIFDYFYNIKIQFNKKQILTKEFNLFKSLFECKEAEYNFYRDLFLFDDPMQYNKIDRFGLKYPDFSKNIAGYTFTDIYKNNYKIKEKLENTILNEKVDYRRFRYLKNMYKNMFSTDYRYNLFKGYNTFIDYLKDKDSNIVDFINRIEFATVNHDTTSASANSYYDEGILEICSAIENALDSTYFDFLVEGNTTILEYIKDLIYQLINFCKAYTVQIKDINNIILFDDIYPNIILLFDIIQENHHIFSLPDLLMLKDTLGILNKMPIAIDKLFELRDLIIVHTILRNVDKLDIKDLDKLDYFTNLSLVELYALRDNEYYQQNIIPIIEFISENLTDVLQIDSIISNNEKYHFIDNIKTFIDKIKIADLLAIREDLDFKNTQALLDLFELDLKDNIKINNTLELSYKFIIRDLMNDFNLNIKLSDLYSIIEKYSLLTNIILYEQDNLSDDLHLKSINEYSSEFIFLDKLIFDSYISNQSYYLSKDYLDNNCLIVDSNEYVYNLSLIFNKQNVIIEYLSDKDNNIYNKDQFKQSNNILRINKNINFDKVFITETL